MQTTFLYFSTVAIFLLLDIVALRTLVAPMFRAHIGHMMLDAPRLGAAGLFYLFYVLGLVILVSWPALHANAPVQGLLMGALLGAVAYGTYEVTNFATLKGWSLEQVVVDGLWGTFLTGFSAWAGIVMTRALFEVSTIG